MENKDDMIPPQHVGKKLDTENEVNAPSEEEAKRLFQLAATRLLNVNQWDKVCGPLSSVFKLTDGQGTVKEGDPTQGDYFRIDVPGPGSSTGEGYDWVRVEAIDDQRNPEANSESLTVRVRPASNPRNDNNDTAHFLADEATSSFRIARDGKTVRAEVHGRNEVSNTKAEKPIDKVRNAVVGTGAVAGMSNPQWKSLVTGLLEQKK